MYRYNLEELFAGTNCERLSEAPQHRFGQANAPKRSPTSPREQALVKILHGRGAASLTTIYGFSSIGKRAPTDKKSPQMGIIFEPFDVARQGGVAPCQEFALGITILGVLEPGDKLSLGACR